MKKIVLLFVFSLSIGCLSQNKEILYNLTSTPQSLLSNPGSDYKYTWFVGIPFMSGISANLGSSGFSAFDLFANDGANFMTKVRDVVAKTSRKDKIAINQQIEIISGGFKLGDWRKSEYLSFGMYQETDVLAYLPHDYAVLALDGNEPYLGRVFNMSDLNASAEILSVFHIGYHKNINEKLIVGARGKIYSSIFNVSSIKNSGEFYTTTDPYFYYKQVISSNILVNTSGLTNYTNNYSGNFVSDILKKTLLGGNLGLGFDAGVTYYPKKNIQITASVVDFGFINHTKQIESYSYKGYYQYEGLTPDLDPLTPEEDILADFNAAIPLVTFYKKYKTLRPIKFNSSVQYSFGDGLPAECTCIEGNEIKQTNSVGAQLFVMSTPRSPIVAFTGYYRRKLFDSLEMKATYTIDSYSSKNIGLGLATTMRKVNFYFTAGNLLEYSDISKANSLSLQMGLNIVIPEKNTPE